MMTLDSKKTRPGKWTLAAALLTAVTGIALSLFLYARLVQSEKDSARLTAEALQTGVKTELNRFAEVLESVRALHALSEAVDQAAMDEFIQKGMVHQQTVLGSFGLAQQIDHPMRLSIESKQQPAPGAYTVVRPGPDGSWLPQQPRGRYYPLTWQSRTDGLHVPVGFDFLSLPAARQAVGRMERLRQTVLVHEPLPERFGRGYWVFAPVVPRGGPPRVIGCAVAVLKPEAILRKVASLSAASPRLKLTPASAAPPADIRLQDQMWIVHLPVSAIATDWMLECSLPLAVAERRSTLALFFGLTVTALMTGLLLLLAGRTRRIEIEVQTRTDELRVANRQLEQNIKLRAQMEEEMSELSASEQRRIGRDLHDSLGQKLTGAVFLSRSLLNWFEKQGARGMEQSGKEKTEDREQKTEDSLSAEVSPKTEGQESGVRSQGSEIKGQGSDSKTPSLPHSHTSYSPTSDRRSPTSELPAPGSRLPAFGPQADHAHTLNETLKSAVAQVRNMARGLASVTLNDESLEESLHQLTDEMSALYSIPCELTQTGQLPPLDRKTKEQLYFIAREAVNNAARHAKPNTITIQLTGEEMGWSLCIQDDGSGLPGGAQVDPKQSQRALRPETGGMGLRIMRHRANRIGAAFAIQSPPGKGTIITVESGTQPQY